MSIDIEELEDKYSSEDDNFNERMQRHAKRFSKRVYGNQDSKKYGKPRRESSVQDF